MVAHVYSACGCACALSMPVDPGPDSRHAQLHEVLRSTSPMLLPLIVTVTQPSHSDGRKHSASRLIYLIVVSACNEVFATVRIIHAHILSKSSAQQVIRHSNNDPSRTFVVLHQRREEKAHDFFCGLVGPSDSSYPVKGPFRYVCPWLYNTYRCLVSMMRAVLWVPSSSTSLVMRGCRLTGNCPEPTRHP